MVVHVVVVELAVGVMPQLVVSWDDCFVIVEHLKRFSIDGSPDAVEAAGGPFLYRLFYFIVQADPDEAAEPNFAA